MIWRENILDYLECGIVSEEDYNNILFVDGDKRISCATFWSMVADVAQELYDKKIAGEAIAVMAYHTVDTIVRFLGILASGNYYIPVNPDIKKDKLDAIMKASGAKLLFDSDEELPCTCYEAGKLRELFCVFRNNTGENTPMYIVFTSGSTGEPKGIVKSGQSMVSFLDAYIKEFDFDKNTCLGNQTPFFFDASAKDIYTCIKTGCTMHILDSKLFVMPMSLGEYIRDNNINTLQWVPSALCMLSKLKVLEKVDMSCVKKVMFVGEVFPAKQLRLWMEALPGASFINLYGSSELAGICCFYRVNNVGEYDSVPIGYPLSNSRIYLIGDGRLIQEKGVTGELFVSGPALADGYIGNAEKTDETFVDTPLKELPEGRYYRSKDLARYGDAGELIFVSRSDYQIKHMGHRIELGEIETVATDCGGIEKCCVIYNASKLILFYEGEAKKADIIMYLRDKLVAYMLPNKVINIEKIPVNANGKTDRNKLLEYIAEGMGNERKQK